MLGLVNTSKENTKMVIQSSFKNSQVGKNTAIINLDNSKAKYHLTIDGKNWQGQEKLNKIFCDMYISQAFTKSVSQKTLSKLIPKFLIVKNFDQKFNIYKSVQFNKNKILFLNVNTEKTFKVRGERDLSYVDCLKASKKYEIALSNQDAYFRKYCPDTEIEYKFNLDNSKDIWQMSCHFYNLIKKGKLPNFNLQFLDPFNQWVFNNHLYEVKTPKESRGYISFIECPDNKFVIKQKVYSKDTLKRIEIRTKNVTIPNTMDEYLKKHYPKISCKKLTPFNRKRYDVNLESLKTGNIYSIMFDRSKILNKFGHVLTQCEIEYLKSRTVGKFRQVEKELKTVREFVKNQFKKQQIEFQETFYSKMTFLKDVKNDKLFQCPV